MARLIYRDSLISVVLQTQVVGRNRVKEKKKILNSFVLLRLQNVYMQFF